MVDDTGVLPTRLLVPVRRFPASQVVDTAPPFSYVVVLSRFAVSYDHERTSPSGVVRVSGRPSRLAVAVWCVPSAAVFETTLRKPSYASVVRRPSLSVAVSTSPCEP